MGRYQSRQVESKPTEIRNCAAKNSETPHNNENMPAYLIRHIEQSHLDNQQILGSMVCNSLRHGHMADKRAVSEDGIK